MLSRLFRDRISRASKTRSRPRRLHHESLERRQLLAADIAITDLRLVNAQRQPISELTIGEMAIVQTDWRTTDLTSSDQYRVRFEMNGVSVYSGDITGGEGVNLPHFWWRGVGYAGDGPQTITVTIDGDGTVAEANESNNSMTLQFTAVSPDLVEPMQWPIGGQHFGDWSVVNYSDVDLRSGTRSDYRGGPFQYDGHDALDLTLPNFATMERGVPVFSAAGGTVIETSDGFFDRNTGASSEPANYVAVDHGNGWVAYYYHLQTHTVAVEVGQTVVAGQTLGLVGSSGNSTDAHLHFSLYHNGSRVEPMFASDTYFDVEFPYQGDLAPTVTASGITDAAPWDDFKEQPNDIRAFRTDSGEDTWIWYRLSHLNVGDVTRVEWYRPDGSFDGNYGFTAQNPVRYGSYGWVRNTRHTPGTWRVDVKVNGELVTSESFDVIADGGVPALDVRHQNARIINDRSTPIDYGIVDQGDPAVHQVFELSNRGSSILNLSNIELPDGYAFVGATPDAIAVNATETITIAMQSDTVGAMYGEVVVFSDDVDEPAFSFVVSGVVIGDTPVGTPVVSTSLPALVLAGGDPAMPVFTDATIFDADNSSLPGSRLTAKIVTGKREGDRLAMSARVGEASPFTRTGGIVSHNGERVGELTKDGVDGDLIIDIDSSISGQVLNALARDIQFWATDSTTEAGRREVLVQFTDSDGNASLPVSRAVMTDGSTLTQPATDFNVSGDIVVDTFWTDPTQPYTLVGDVRVRNGATLFVGPGVTVNRSSNQHDLSIGLNAEVGQLSVTNSTFNIDILNSATAHSVFEGATVSSGEVLVESGSDVSFTNTAFHSGTPLSVHPEFPIELAGNGNSFSAGATIEIIPGVVDIDTTWPTLPGMMTYELLRRDGFSTSAGPRVRDNAVLTIANGVTVQEFGSDTDLRVSDNGSGGSLVADNVNFLVDLVASAQSTLLVSDSQLTGRKWVIESGSDVHFTNTNFHGGTPLSVHPEFPDELAGLGNSFAAGAQIEVTNGIVDEDTTWPLLPGMSTYQLKTYSGIFSGSLGPRVRSDAVLTIADGLRVYEVGSDTDLRVSDNGTGGSLIANNVEFSANVIVETGGDAAIANSRVQGGRFDIEDGTTVSFTNTSLHGGTPLSVHPEFPGDLADRGNTFDAGSQIEITSGIVDEDTTWPLLPGMSTYQLKTYSGIFSGSLGPRIRDNAFLYLGDGIHVYENGSDTDLRVSDDGSGGGFVSEGARIDIDLFYLENSDGWITDSLLGPNHILVIHDSTEASFLDNDFSRVSNNGLVAIGVNTATIDVRGNFWGDISTNEIESKLLDNLDDGNRPRVLFEPTLPTNPLSPGVENIQINGGDDSRSQVTYLTVQFDRTVRHDLLANAFTLTNIDADVMVGQIEIVALDSGGRTNVRLTFSGSSTDSRAGHNGTDLRRFNSLSDGNYRLDIDQAMIVNADVDVSMQEPIAFGGADSTDQFFRLYGDDDGDGDVDAADLFAFRRSFRRSEGQPFFNSALDYDGDGDVDAVDLFAFRSRYRTNIN